MEEQKKVYLLMAGEYSDRGVVAVCSTKERAEQLTTILNDRGGAWGDEVYIDERPLDNLPVEDLSIPVWCVVFDYRYWACGDQVTVEEVPRGDYLEINSLNPYILRDWSSTPGGRYYGVYIMAENKESAIKKASDYLAKYRAEKEGL